MLLQERQEFVEPLVREVHPRAIKDGDSGSAGDQVGKATPA
ncbi:hypothetical protein [Mycobacterium talmoniae]|nr:MULTISPECIES: hypothetical protein [Mycobacterium]